MGSSMFFGVFLCVLASQGLVSGQSDVQVSSDGTNSTTKPTMTVDFYLYTRQSLTNPEILQGTSVNDGLFTTLMNRKPIKVLVHGWLESNEKRFSKTVMEGLLKYADFNVIVVEWSGEGSESWEYHDARQKVPEVAAELGQFLDNHIRQLGLRLDAIHILGHGMGAHIAGIGGFLMKTGRVARITALDPSGPLFTEDKPTERLTRYSAKFIDAIHTCGDYLGTMERLGDADFYPNGGNFKQPGCGMDLQGTCSHRRAYVLYLESLVNPWAFLAVRCGNWEGFLETKQHCDVRHPVYMGEKLTKNHGSFYFKTNDKAPHGLGYI